MSAWALQRRNSQTSWDVLDQQESMLESISDVCHGLGKGTRAVYLLTLVPVEDGEA